MDNYCVYDRTKVKGVEIALSQVNDDIFERVFNLIYTNKSLPKHCAIIKNGIILLENCDYTIKDNNIKLGDEHDK